MISDWCRISVSLLSVFSCLLSLRHPPSGRVGRSPARALFSLLLRLLCVLRLCLCLYVSKFLATLKTLPEPSARPSQREGDKKVGWFSEVGPSPSGIVIVKSIPDRSV